MTLRKKAFQNIMGKGNQHVLLFPCFLAFQNQILIFWLFLSALSDYARSRKRAGRHEKGAGRKKHTVNSLPNDKILDWSKFKAFADDNLMLLEL